MNSMCRFKAVAIFFASLYSCSNSRPSSDKNRYFFHSYQLRIVRIHRFPKIFAARFRYLLDITPPLTLPNWPSDIHSSNARISFLFPGFTITTGILIVKLFWNPIPSEIILIFAFFAVCGAVEPLYLSPCYGELNILLIFMRIQWLFSANFNVDLDLFLTYTSAPYFPALLKILDSNLCINYHVSIRIFFVIFLNNFFESFQELSA